MPKIITIVIFILLTVGLCIAGGYVIADMNKASNNDSPITDTGALEENDKDIEITLLCDEYCAILTESTVRLKKGEIATFSVIFDTNYAFDSFDSENATYSNGKVKIGGYTESATVTLKSKCIATMVDFDIAYPNSSFGSVNHSISTGAVLEGTMITVSATPAKNQTFIGWSADASIVDGGAVLSYSTDFTFEAKSNVKLYPNFLEEGYTIIKYDLNGGTTADGSSSVILTQFKKDSHLCPNLIADNGTIVREGYNLIEFSENQDGSGTVVNPGGMTALPKEGSIITFYAQWAEWSDPDFFIYTSRGDGTVKITGYTSDEPVLSIPSHIDGKKVTAIAANSVLGRNFETLIIPYTVTTIESKAFVNCNKFTTLYITDSFTSVPNDAFSNRKITNLRLNASLPPHFITHAENVGARFEILLSREDDKPLMMFVGGSSCLYGIRAESLEAKLDYKYHVLNCGTNAGGLGILYMEALSHFMRPGDVIVNVPEYGANQMGGTKIEWRVFRAMVSCYNLFRYIDFSRYTNFFAALSEYNTSSEARYAGSPQTYETKYTGLTPTYCDLKGTRAPAATPNFSSQNVKESTITDDKIKVINTLIDQLNSKNITFYFSCAPICDGTGTQSTNANIEKYYQRLIKNLKCPVISNPVNYRFPATDYNNSSYHLCTEAAERRTHQVYLDLLAQFEKEAAQAE